MSVFSNVGNFFQFLNDAWVFDDDNISPENNSQYHYKDAEGTEYHWRPAAPKRSSFTYVFDVCREIAEDVEFEEINYETLNLYE